MSNELSRTLALAKQAYGDLLQVTSLDALRRREFGAGPKRDRVEELLSKLNSAINGVERFFDQYVTASAEPPALSISAAHRSFYNDVLRPHGKELQRAYFEISGLDMFVDLLDSPDDGRPTPRMLNAISWALERWSGMLDEDEAFDWRARGFDIEGAEAIVAAPWFQPDAWAQNFQLLQPVLLDRPTYVLRDHVRYRLTEIYRAFAYGLWMAAIALSRSLVEFSLKANAPRFEISVTVPGVGGRPEDKSLKQLGEDFSRAVPDIAVAIERVREAGNRILHPKKHYVVSHPKVMRSEALECVQAAQQIVEALYSELSSE